MGCGSRGCVGALVFNPHQPKEGGSADLGRCADRKVTPRWCALDEVLSKRNTCVISGLCSLLAMLEWVSESAIYP